MQEILFSIRSMSNQNESFALQADFCTMHFEIDFSFNPYLSPKQPERIQIIKFSGLGDIPPTFVEENLLSIDRKCYFNKNNRQLAFTLNQPIVSTIQSRTGKLIITLNSGIKNYMSPNFTIDESIFILCESIDFTVKKLEQIPWYKRKLVFKFNNISIINDASIDIINQMKDTTIQDNNLLIEFEAERMKQIPINRIESYYLDYVDDIEPEHVLESIKSIIIEHNNTLKLISPVVESYIRSIRRNVIESCSSQVFWERKFPNYKYLKDYLSGLDLSNHYSENVWKAVRVRGGSMQVENKFYIDDHR